MTIQRSPIIPKIWRNPGLKPWQTNALSSVFLGAAAGGGAYLLGKAFPDPGPSLAYLGPVLAFATAACVTAGAFFIGRWYQRAEKDWQDMQRGCAEWEALTQNIHGHPKFKEIMRRQDHEQAVQARRRAFTVVTNDKREP